MKTRILIVDDNADLTNIVSLILTSEGFLVKVCHSLSGCIGLINDWNPHILLLDVNVNGEDGRELCRKLKSVDEQNELKILLMSGDENTLEQGFGADGRIAKPFDSGLLIKNIRECLQPVNQNT
jgi:DNA-binding response OmpR family regulator